MLPIQRSTPAEGSVGGVGGASTTTSRRLATATTSKGRCSGRSATTAPAASISPGIGTIGVIGRKAIGGTEGFAPSMSPTHPMTHRSHDAGAPWCILASSYGSYPDPHPAARVTWGYLPVTCRLPRRSVDLQFQVVWRHGYDFAASYPSEMLLWDDNFRAYQLVYLCIHRNATECYRRPRCSTNE